MDYTSLDNFFLRFFYVDLSMIEYIPFFLPFTSF